MRGGPWWPDRPLHDEEDGTTLRHQDQRLMAGGPRGDHPRDVILGGLEVAGSPRGDHPRDVILGDVSDLQRLA